MSIIHTPLTRYPENPILTPEQMPFRCYTVMNAGATIFEGKVLLLLRVEDCERQTDFYVATSTDGINFDVCETPINLPLTEQEKRYGASHRFDMRITFLEGKYYVCHAAWLGKYGSCIGMATTEDFVNFEPIPYLSEPSNRNAVLFPEKIGGLYARLDRPQNVDGSGYTWISYSPDLIFWGKAMPLDLPYTSWNRNKNGAGSIPIKTPHGWLEIFHATAETCSTENYYLGVALLDLEDPSKVLASPREFVLAAEKDYECMGQTPNVVFTSGGVVMPDGTYNIYYGGADTRMCLATTTIKTLIDYCHADPKGKNSHVVFN
ncbi:MAG: glycoside hydrolase family 130 protein [Planctomycetes bacterium]|nr:glycoside hydrolase family 130 protein [Planctomycetota bacterium]